MTETAPFRISVVMPAYNEEAVIEATVTTLATALDAEKLDYEIRVVDDGSKDCTWTLLQQLTAANSRVHPIKNTGYGGFGMAVRAGLSSFEGDGVIIAMADGSDSPEDIIAYARALAGGYDCAFGARFTGTTKVTGYPVVKRILNRMGNRLIAWLTGVRYDDFTNGFKGYRRGVIDAIQPLVSADFNLTVELSIKAVLSGATFAVIPNAWRDRDGGVSKFKIAKLGKLYLLTIAYCLIQNYLRSAGARKR
jgi:dolichol-phosphate mannosyltransferase